MSTPELDTDLSDLDALARGIDWSADVSFYFLVVDDLHLRDRAIQAVVSRVRTREPRFVSIEPDKGGLVDQLCRLPALRPSDLVIVTGFERILRDDRASADSPFVRNLNAARDAIGRIAPCPILFVVARFVLNALARGAPDFFSTVSGVSVYTDTVAPDPGLIERDFIRGPAIDLSAVEQAERIGDVENMLAMLTGLETFDSRTYLRVAYRLVGLLFSHGDLSRAADVARRALAIASETDPRQALEFASLLGQMAVFTRDREAVAAYAARVDDLASRLGDDQARFRAEWLHAYAEAANHRTDAAVGHYLAARSLAEKIGDPVNGAQVELALGNLRLGEGRAEDALSHFHHALALAEEANERPLVAQARWSLAAALLQTGRALEAEETLRASIRELERLGDSVQLAMAYLELGDVLLAEDRKAEAERAFLKSLELGEQSAVLPSRKLAAMLRLIPLKLQKGDQPSAASLVGETLSMIERLRSELPDTTAIEEDLRTLRAELARGSDPHFP